MSREEAGLAFPLRLVRLFFLVSASHPPHRALFPGQGSPCRAQLIKYPHARESRSIVMRICRQKSMWVALELGNRNSAPGLGSRRF
jgi:hypothetical protein